MKKSTANKDSKVVKKYKAKSTANKASKVVKKHKTKELSSSQSNEPKEVSIIDRAKEIIAKSKSSDKTESNEFCRMQQEIAERIVEYDRIRKECQITDEARSATIYRLAKSFLEGNFTLAVVGKTSSGKSTFINTLVGDNLFPTGRFQTTSTLAFIEQGDKMKMEVLFCDGHQEIICDDTQKIKERLKQLIAIPEEYRHLPIYDINILISGGDDIETILKKKKGIEERTHRQTDESLWKRYVNCHEKKDIAKEVHITCRLSDEYQGWRIIDTPGIGTSGGIQEATLKLFSERDNDGNNLIDAIVFLHDGTDNIEDERAYEFMESIVKGLTENAKKRLFFVLTKASESVFRAYKKETMQLAKELYAKSFKIPEERFTYIDSLLERLNNDVKDKKYYGKLECPSNWDKNEWKLMTDLYPIIIEQIKNSGIEPTSTAVKDVINEWSNFGHFKLILNKFFRDENAITYNTICGLIEEDCLGFKNDLEDEIAILEKKKNIQEEKEKISRKSIMYHDLLNRLEREASIDKIWPEFNFIDERISTFRKIESIDQIEKECIQIQDEAESKEKKILENIKIEFKKYITNDIQGSIARFKMIDFDELMRRAIDETPKIFVPGETETKKGRLWKPDEVIVKRYPTEEDDAIGIRNHYTAHVIKGIRQEKENFKKELTAIVKMYCDLINGELQNKCQTADSKLQQIEEQLQLLEKQLDSKDKDKQIADLKTKLEIIEKRKLW